MVPTEVKALIADIYLKRDTKKYSPEVGDIGKSLSSSSSAYTLPKGTIVRWVNTVKKNLVPKKKRGPHGRISLEAIEVVKVQTGTKQTDSDCDSAESFRVAELLSSAQDEIDKNKNRIKSTLLSERHVRRLRKKFDISFPKKKNEARQRNESDPRNFHCHNA